MITSLLVPLKFYRVSKYVYSNLEVILEQDGNISLLKSDILTYINDITRISPVTWAVLSNQIMAWLINIKIRFSLAYLQECLYRFTMKMCLCFQRSCQSAFLAKVCTDIHIYVLNRIYQIRIYSLLAETRQFAWYINFIIILRKFLQVTD